MARKASDAGVNFRPHFKTHQSAEIGELFRTEGIKSITVSSVSMAQYFARHGWTDITIAFPANLLEIKEINILSSKIKLNLLIESEATARFFNENLTSECGFFIKIDTGYHRTGIEFSNISLIETIIKTVNPTILKFKGFLAHYGNTYNATNQEDILNIQSFATEKLLLLKKHFIDRYPELLISVGDTPSCSQLPLPKGINEIRPGNFVFYDVMQFTLGSCKLQNIAVALICPVVAIHHNRKEAVLYGGAIHLSKDRTFIPPDTAPVYGIAVGWDGSKWDTEMLLGKIISLSQEHGIISLTQAGCNLQPGDKVAVLPVHSCLTAHLMKLHFTNSGLAINT
jgi:D-serine deaminase-like pyridoxal phosphate-dependent protein